MMNINVYKITHDFNIPKFDSPHHALNLEAGHRIISIDDEVFVKTVKRQDELSDDSYIKALITKKFIQINPKLFQRI